MALTSSLAFIALLLCFSFSVKPQPYFNPIASAPVSWTNTPSDFTYNYMFSGGEMVNSLLLRLNVTHGLSFATGFYCFPPCKSYFLSIYIVFAYSDYPRFYPNAPQVIWSANRSHPVSQNATLQLTSQDGLTLRDSDGSLVWSTSGLNRSVAGINITEAGDRRIFANSSSTDLAESQFYLTLLADGLYGYVNSNPPLVYYHYPNFYYIGDKSVSIKFMNGSLTMFSMLSNIDNGTLIFALPPSKSIQTQLLGRAWPLCHN